MGSNNALLFEAVAARKRNEDSKGPALLRLPGEVRNIIYNYVVEDNRWSYPRHGNEVEGKAIACSSRVYWRKAQYKPNRQPLAMTLTCHKLYIETRHLPFDTTTFKFRCMSHLDLWLAQTAPPYLNTFYAEITRNSRSDHSGHFGSLDVEGGTFERNCGWCDASMYPFQYYRKKAMPTPPPIWSTADLFGPRPPPPMPMLVPPIPDDLKGRWPTTLTQLRLKICRPDDHILAYVGEVQKVLRQKGIDLFLE
ncbi:hypothetical protein SLS60_000089 [Paraconiothyrium brasiliense]|uniref:Uncharacterized protein n=1 Tax=Paraconiothyrium brasiliense TaxID=300254 RepID=A0ABR3S5U7_9PLEO